MSPEIVQLVRLAGVGVLSCLVLLTLLNTFRYIPNNKVGVVEKMWSLSGSLKHGLIALNGEAGFQPTETVDIIWQAA